MSQFTKPENALKRAEELISIGAKNEALQTLHSVITSRKFRNWQQVLEKIMLKYLSLCVEMREGKLAKDGLHQYRVTCQQYGNTASLETVVKHFLQQADEYAKEAQQKAEKMTLDIEDLEAEESVESLMLSSVSGEDSKDRADREIVTPWLKFLWETYRTILEILRNNPKLEHLYRDTAQHAFHFCLKYKRHTEFKRLSEMFRTHLATIGRNQQGQGVNLNVPETLQLHLDTRFAQLNAAVELELWQEAFRTIEDIHNLLTMSKKAPKPQTLAAYYQRLAQIFWVSGNYLFHAYSCNRFYLLSKSQNKSLTEEESKVLASTVLLATLSIPLDSTEDFGFDIDIQKERNLRMAMLLSFTSVPVVPTRESLIQEVIAKIPASQLLPELQDFYNLLEKKFNPLKLSTTLKPKLEFVSKHDALKKYQKPLEKLVFIRQLQQLAKVYDMMKISEFTKLIYFANLSETEKLLVEAVKNKYVDVRIDYQRGALNFKTQTLESEQTRNQLTQLAKNLQVAVRMINPEKQTDDTNAQRKKELFSKILQNLEDDHQKALARKSMIEKRIEMREQQIRKKAQLEEEERKKKLQQQKIEEEQRLAKLREEVERRRQEKEIKEQKEKQIKALAEQMGAPVDTATVDMSLDPDEIIRRRLLKHEQDQQELTKQIKKLEKRMNWTERAKRMEERKLLLDDYEKTKKDDEVYYKEQMESFLITHKETHVRELEEKKRLSRMLSDKEKFEETLFKGRQEQYEILKKERDQRLAIKKAKLKEEREKREREEAERKAEIERQRKIQEEEDRKRREQDEKRRQEEEERQRKLQDQAERQRKREEEVMAKQTEPQEDKGVEKYRPPVRREPEPRSKTWDREPPRDRDFRRDDREPPRRDDRDFRRDDRDREPPRRDERDFRRDDRDRDREPLRRDDRDFRRDDRELPRRDDREPPRRDDRDFRRDDRDREPPRRDERDFRRDDRDREPPRRDDRDFRRDDRDREPPRRDDREPPRRDDTWRRDDRDREPPRRDDRDFRRDDRDREPPRRDERDFREREPPRRDDRDISRRDDREREPPRREPVRKEDSWRSERKDDRRDEKRDERPRESAKRDEKPASPRDQEEASTDGNEEDGFTQVKQRRSKK